MGASWAYGMAAMVEDVSTLRGSVRAHLTSNVFPPITDPAVVAACCMAVEGYGGLLDDDPELRHDGQHGQLYQRIVARFRLEPFADAAAQLRREGHSSTIDG